LGAKAGREGAEEHHGLAGWSRGEPEKGRAVAVRRRKGVVEEGCRRGMGAVADPAPPPYAVPRTAVAMMERGGRKR
jgi:hypothetical protein